MIKLLFVTVRHLKFIYLRYKWADCRINYSYDEQHLHAASVLIPILNEIVLY